MTSKYLKKLLVYSLVCMISVLTFSAVTISGSETTDISQQNWGVEEVYEVEPNDSFTMADSFGTITSGVRKDGIGQIGDPYKDKDFWKFTLSSTGSVSIYISWMGGSHFTDGNERDFYFGLYDSSYNLVATGVFEFAGYSYFAYRVIEKNLSSGTYYLQVSVAQNSNTPLYRNEPYNIQLNYDALPVSKIAMARLPKTSYIPGETFDSTGGRFDATYSDGSKQRLSLTNSMISGYNRFASYGPQTVYVSYEGRTTSFTAYIVRFSDVPYEHQVYSRIDYLARKGIINGYQDNTFRPNNNITRAQAAVMIVRALGIDYRGKKSSFSDVPSTHSSYEFISAAYEAGIISGYSVDNTFRPNDNITRQQIAVMIQRAFNVKHSGSNVSFTDVKSSMPSKSYIETLASQSIINGYSDGSFRPNNNTTRAQFSSMIYNAMRYK